MADTQLDALIEQTKKEMQELIDFLNEED